MTVMIYKGVQNLTQSAPTKDVWILESAQSDHNRLDPIMGWISSDDTVVSQVELRFDSKQQAIQYAKKHKLDYTVIDDGDDVRTKMVIKSYLDNFKI